MPTVWESVIGLIFLMGSILMLGAYHAWIKAYEKIFNVEPNLMEEFEYPNAVVILPVRGLDPFLETTLCCLFQQDYARLEIIILADSQDDPAILLAEGIRQKFSHINCKIGVFQDFSRDRSLKVSAIIEGVKLTSPEVSVVAILDADAQPHPTWLKELVKPLVVGNSQVCCGIRWYSPQKFSIGTVVRQLWNIFAIVQMHHFSIPWGGSLAFTKASFNQALVQGYFDGAFSEDTTFGKFLIEHHQSLIIVPTLIMVNREQTDLAGAITFIRRQMIVARLHHPRWINILWWNCLFFIVPLMIYSTLILGLVSGWVTIASISFLTICLVQFRMLGYAYWVGRIIRRVQLIKKSDERNCNSKQFLSDWTILPLLYLTLIITFFTTISAHCARRVSWRGIDYQILKNKTVRMENYKPYKRCMQPINKENSL